MIPIPSGTGHTDMRRGMHTWLLRFRSPSGAIPTPGHLYIFRAAAATSLKSFGVAASGLSLYVKRLDRGKFICPSASDGAVSISAAQMAYMLEASAIHN
jgi:transposase